MAGAKLLFHNCLVPASSSLRNVMVNSLRCVSQGSVLKKNNTVQTDLISRNTEDFEAPSPYKKPGPRRYGYHITYKTDGLLPRDGKPVRALPKYKPKDRWHTKAAMFGQNDYIDILGDGDIHPSDLLTGPPWLVAFRGNERDRLLRKMEWQGARLKVLYPAEFNRMEKRIRYLTKLYNTKRHNKKID